MGTTIRFHTLGCKVNQYETQALAQLFLARGYYLLEDCEAADPDVVVVNSCTVTAQGDRKCRQLLRRLRREHPQAALCLTGCYPQAYPAIAREMPELDVVTGSRNRAGLAEAVERRLATGQRVVAILPHQPGEAFEAMTVEDFSHRTRAFVKIEDGCENHCAYCIIPTARGPVRSKPLAQLEQELAALDHNGHREVVLAGINLGSYGRDLPGQPRLADAIEAACDLPGIQRVRLGSVEPDLITPEDLTRMAAQDKLCPQFHLSLQSGCDTVLARMGRRYTTAHYLALAAEIRRRWPDAAITTDLMVGFPGETEAEFAASLDFARQVGFAKIHVFAYSPRQGTRAAAMAGQVAPAVKKQRSRRLTDAAEELRRAFLQAMVGQTVEVLFEEHLGACQAGYTTNYTPVTVPDTRNLRGRLLPVLITGVEGDGCTGVLV